MQTRIFNSAEDAFKVLPALQEAEVAWQGAECTVGAQ